LNTTAYLEADAPLHGGVGLEEIHHKRRRAELGTLYDGGDDCNDYCHGDGEVDDVDGPP
jgi:hypothetical protein